MLSLCSLLKRSVALLFIGIANSVTFPPRCLDFQSPFQSSATAGFCADYTQFGCCGKSGEHRLVEEYNYIQSKVGDDEWNRCKVYVKEILCQKCSPYATHLYGALTSKGQTFPNICQGYCNTFYDACRNFLWFLDPDLAAKTILTPKIKFCKMVSPKDDGLCYPNILNNSKTYNPRDGVSSRPTCICLKEVGKRLANPLFARPANDGSGRVFVAEQRGRVLIYNSQKETWNKIPFLDFRLKSFHWYRPADERGFYTLAFHPKFASNKRFFISYYALRKFWKWWSVPDELKDLPLKFRAKVKISEMTVSRWCSNIANYFSEKTILEVLQPWKNHNGGEMFFGEDGYLYTFHGDGGFAGDPQKMAQNKKLPYGKVFRLDVDSDPKKRYTIPPDNPFVGDSDAKPEIYAYGVRNIWRCGLDPGDRTTGESRGRVLCGDVGQYEYEEIDVLKKGANYGWSAREGYECFDDTTCGNIGEEELPITVYNRSVGLSVTGGVFYRGCQSPNLNGYYIYGDYASKRLFTLVNESGSWQNEDLPICSQEECQGNLLSGLGGKILSFGQDEDGEAYILTSKSSSSLLRNGNMYKIVDPGGRLDPSDCENAVLGNRRVPLPKRNSVWVQAYKLQMGFGSNINSASEIIELINKWKV